MGDFETDFGQYGFKIITAGNTEKGPFCAVEAVNAAATFTGVTFVSRSDDETARVLPDSVPTYGPYKTVQCTAGTVKAYYSPRAKIN